MPSYHVAKKAGLLYHQGRILDAGEQLTLTEEQAAALGAKVIRSEVADPDKPIAEQTVKELRATAKLAGVESYSTKDKAELIAALTAVAAPEEEVAEAAVAADDEPAGN